VFFAYATMNGLTFSILFLVYTASSIGGTFFITAGTFAAVSVYGSTTKRDLTGVGSFMMMGLFGIIIASVVNLFLGNEMLSWIIGYLCVIIFTGLTAYHTQKILALNVLGNEGTDEDRKEAITGALILYLDFVNLFLSLLRLMGRRR
jgi:FtsH-binding integral membrane protein